MHVGSVTWTKRRVLWLWRMCFWMLLTLGFLFCMNFSITVEIQNHSKDLDDIHDSSAGGICVVTTSRCGCFWPILLLVSWLLVVDGRGGSSYCFLVDFSCCCCCCCCCYCLLWVVRFLAPVLVQMVAVLGGGVGRKFNSQQQCFTPCGQPLEVSGGFKYCKICKRTVFDWVN